MNKNTKPAPITEFEIQEILEQEKKLILKIEGYLPDSASKLQTEDIRMDENQKTVFIKILIERDPMVMAMQVIRRFSKEVPIVFPLDGKWKIRCNDKELETEIA